MADIFNSTSNTLVNGTSENDSITNFESDNVTIKADLGNDYILNYAAKNCMIIGGAGNDTILIEEGNNIDNTIVGGAGDDSIYTISDGANVYIYNEGDGNDTIENRNIYNSYPNNYMLQINSSNIGVSVISGNNVVIPVGDGSITLIDAAPYASSLNIVSNSVINNGSETVTPATVTPAMVTPATGEKFTLESTMTSNGHNYYLISTSVESGATAWNDARSYFKTKFGGDLAIINDANENVALFNFIREKTTEAYFGLTDAAQEGTWTWVDNTPISYAPWGSGEPNGGIVENHAYFYFDDGTWNDGDVGYRGFVQENGVYFLGEANGGSETVTPATVTPSTVTPATVTPATVTPATVTPATITPSTVTPATVTPATVTPATVTPETVASELINLAPVRGNAAYDIVFIVDTSGSMDTYINRVSEISNTFINMLAARGITDYRLAVVDYETEPSTYFLGADGGVFTTSTDEVALTNFKGAMAQAAAKNSGSTENGLYAINHAINNYPFRENANVKFIVLTDEDYDDGATFDLTATEQALKDRNIQLDVIGKKNDSCESEWTPVANSTGGNFYDITSDYGVIFSEIASNFDQINVNLATVADGQTGFFFIPYGKELDTENGVDAIFVPSDMLHLFIGGGFESIGAVYADKTYVGLETGYRQNITIPDNWTVTATSKSDILNVAGTGFGVVIASGEGHDVVNLGENAAGIILTDHDLDNDGLTFATRQTPGTFTETFIQNPDMVTNQAWLTSQTMNIILTNFSSSNPEDFSSMYSKFDAYNVTNGDRSNTVYELVNGDPSGEVVEQMPFVNPDNLEGAVQLAQWGYGFEPPEGFMLYGQSYDLAADFGSPALADISPNNFAVTSNFGVQDPTNIFTANDFGGVIATSGQENKI